MATVVYTFVSRCAAGNHTAFDVSFNGGANRRVVFAADEIRAPLSELTADDREQLAALLLRVHFAGRSRQQIVNELASPVTITI